MNHETEILEKLEQFQPLSKNLLILINRLCIEQGIKVRCFFTVIEPFFSDLPWQIQAAIDGLSLGSWIEVIGDEIKAIKEYEEIISDIEIDVPMSGIMERLVELTTTAPCDNLLSKTPYIRMAFSILMYCQKNDYLRFGSDADADVYGKLAVTVARNIGLTNSLGNVHQIYDLPIYKTLEYAFIHVDGNSSVYARICLAFALIHNQVFEYDGAGGYIEEARKNAIIQGTDTEVEVFVAKSDMMLNQTLFGEALFYLKLAYDANLLLHDESCDENTAVILKICDICLALRKKDTCRKWLAKIANYKLSRYSELYIWKTVIEAELCDESEIAALTFEEAELVSWRLYNHTQPYIYSRRSRYYIMHGLYEEGNNEYGAYMRQLRSLYGLTTNGDLAVFYSSRVMTFLGNGAIQTAVNLNALMVGLCPADGPQFSFGARACQYLAIANTYYATHEYVLSCAYSEAVLEQVRRYVKVSSAVVNQIKEIFGSEEEIPASIFAVDLIGQAYLIKANVAIAEGYFENAKSLCLECLDQVRASDEECYILSILGYVYSKLGQIDDAIRTWKQAAETSGEHALEIAAESAWFAYDSGQLDVALDIINEATEKPLPFSTSYASFLTIASICGTAGLEDQKNEFYATARKLSRGKLQLSRCLYNEALNLQDTEAINRLEKAVDYKADLGLCVDEELSLKWKTLAENKNAFGLRNCAKTAAIIAVRLYPADNPDIFEDINDLL